MIRVNPCRSASSLDPRLIRVFVDPRGSAFRWIPVDLRFVDDPRQSVSIRVFVGSPSIRVFVDPHPSALQIGDTDPLCSSGL
jgi:hypothetical protein